MDGIVLVQKNMNLPAAQLTSCSGCFHGNLQRVKSWILWKWIFHQFRSVQVLLCFHSHSRWQIPAFWRENKDFWNDYKKILSLHLQHWALKAHKIKQSLCFLSEKKVSLNYKHPGAEVHLTSQPRKHITFSVESLRRRECFLCPSMCGPLSQCCYFSHSWPHIRENTLYFKFVLFSWTHFPSTRT